MDKKQLASLVRMADHVEITQVMAELVQSFDRFDAMNILQNLMAADHPEVSVEFMEEGLYEGPEKVKAYMLAIQDYLDDPSDKRGFMPLKNLATPHIVVSTSGQRARAQWDILNASAMQATPYPGDQTKLTALWICGRYDNEFIRINGEWKLLKLHLVTYFKSPFEEGWLKDPDCLRFGACKVEPTRPSNPNKIYHSDANYSGDGLHTYGPFLPEKIEDGPAPELVEEKIGMSKEFNAFELRRAIVRHDIYKANLIVKYFNKNDKAGNIFSVVPLLFGFFQNLMIAHYSRNKNNEAALARDLDMKSGWGIRDYVTAMQFYTATKTMQIIAKLREVDEKGKGLGNSNTTKEELLSELIFFILH